MQTRNSVFHRCIATICVASLIGCGASHYGTFQTVVDESTGRTVTKYVMPCYVSRSYTPSGQLIKKEGPQRNLIRLAKSDVKPMYGIDACFEVTAEGKLNHLPGSCPSIEIVSPEMCEDR